VSDYVPVTSLIVIVVAEDAVDTSESQEPVDDVREMSGRWSSRSNQSDSATGRRHGRTRRRHGPRVFSRRDTPRHVRIHKHDRGLKHSLSHLYSYYQATRTLRNVSFSDIARP